MGFCPGFVEKGTSRSCVFASQIELRTHRSEEKFPINDRNHQRHSVTLTQSNYGDVGRNAIA